MNRSLDCKRVCPFAMHFPQNDSSKSKLRPNAKLTATPTPAIDDFPPPLSRGGRTFWTTTANLC